MKPLSDTFLLLVLTYYCQHAWSYDGHGHAIHEILSNLSEGQHRFSLSDGEHLKVDEYQSEAEENDFQKLVEKSFSDQPQVHANFLNQLDIL